VEQGVERDAEDLRGALLDLANPSSRADAAPRRARRGPSAAKGRARATLLLSEHPIAEGQPAALAAGLDDAAPHRADAERAQLQARYLGNLTWQEACDAVGVRFDHLPATTADLPGAAASSPS
jgi:hypothetical protein